MKDKKKRISMRLIKNIMEDYYDLKDSPEKRAEKIVNKIEKTMNKTFNMDIFGGKSVFAMNSIPFNVLFSYGIFGFYEDYFDEDTDLYDFEQYFYNSIELADSDNYLNATNLTRDIVYKLVLLIILYTDLRGVRTRTYLPKDLTQEQAERICKEQESNSKYVLLDVYEEEQEEEW